MERSGLNNYSPPVGSLLTYLNGHLNLSQEFNDALRRVLGAETLTAKLDVVKCGEVCVTANWIERGYARFFKRVADDNGILTDVTIDFCRWGKILVIPECFFNGQPCGYNAEIPKGSVIVPFSKNCFDTFKLSAPEAESLANKILSLERTESLEKRELMKMKPRPRYDAFLRIFGREIEQYFAVKQIASYLGMQPSYLSRLRSEIKRCPTDHLQNKVSVVTFLLLTSRIDLLFN